MPKNTPCSDCGEVGRPKEMLFVGWDAIAYYCHDEEKSCYNYALRMLREKVAVIG